MLDNIFQGFTQIDASPGDDNCARWRSLLPLTVSVPDWLWRGMTPDAVNRAVNYAIRWTDSRETWQPPYTTLACRRGDCMDISVLKFALLQALDFDPANIGIVLGEIKRMPVNEQHAWLLLRSEGRDWVLDNKFDHLIAPHEYINWRPLKLLTLARCQLFSPVVVLAKENPTA